MLLQRENTRKPIKKSPVREAMDDRLYLTKKKSPFREDDDVVIDFDDDVDGIELDYTGYQPKKDNPNLPSHGSNIRHPSDDIQAVLFEINDRLANIEDMLRKGSNSSSQKVTVTTQQTTAEQPVNEALVNGDIMGRLRPPQNVVPEGSMLGEIQSVLAQQASMTGNDPQMAGNTDVSGVCTLPNSAYDDEVPDIGDMA